MKKLLRILSYIVTVLLTAYAVLSLQLHPVSVDNNSSAAATKVNEIEQLLSQYYIDKYDAGKLADDAAAAAVASVGDRWAYYVPLSEMEQYKESNENEYCGVGIVIGDATQQGYRITAVSENSPAGRTGVLAEDELCTVAGQSVAGMERKEIQSRVRGEAGTEIELGFSRKGDPYTVVLRREKVVTDVVSSRMIDDKIGYIRIENFMEHSAEQSKSAVERLMQSGAAGLVFDVRLNPGGEKKELVALLDYLLPEGKVFSGQSYDGKVQDDYSDASCISLPMVVLIDRDTFSAAEFFAAALREYNWAELVGQKTTGKGNYQFTFPLSDGSAVAFSIGRYFTPKGINLSGVGVTPDYEAELGEEQRVLLYGGVLPDQEDLQLQIALEVLHKNT